MTLSHRPEAPEMRVGDWSSVATITSISSRKVIDCFHRRASAFDQRTMRTRRNSLVCS